MATKETVIDVEDQHGVEDQHDVDEGEVPKTGSTKGKIRSITREHFPFMEGAKKTKCKYCSSVLACSSRANGTSGLLSHLKNSCKRSPIYKKSPSSNNQATLNFKSNKTEDGGSLAKHSFSQERGRLALARMCIKDNKPFSVVDDEGFREYSWELRLEFKMVSRWTVARDCNDVFESETDKLKRLLKGQTVSLSHPQTSMAETFEGGTSY
ncbi:hypothetical protein LXL04_001014 [Taraxacum kok-saghyz]